MSGLFNALFSTTNAMRAHGSALDIVSRNMANVNNPAYARQRIIYGSRGSVDTPIGSLSLGVEAVGIAQYRDKILDRQITDEVSNGRSFESQQGFLRQAQTALSQGLFGKAGEVETIGANPELPSGISATIDQFFNTWQSFATNPSSSVEKSRLIAITDDLIGKLHTADSRLADITLPSTGNSLTEQMDADISTVNSLLASIADLNRQIGRVELVNPGTAVDIRDERQGKIEELAKYLDFQTVEQTDGQLGIQVLDSSAAPVLLVNLSVVQGSLARNASNYEWTPTSGPAVTVDVNAGRLHGYQQVGASIQSYRTDLDAFVNQLVSQVNTAYNATTNGNFFTPAGTTAATIARTVTASTLVATDVGGSAGGNDRALAVAAIASNQSFLNGTPAETFGNIVTAVAQDITVVENRLEDQDALSRLLRAQRESYGGVSLDEEAADMLRLQRAFQASAKMLNVMDSLLERIVDGLVR